MIINIQIITIPTYLNKIQAQGFQQWTPATKKGSTYKADL